MQSNNRALKELLHFITMSIIPLLTPARDMSYLIGSRRECVPVIAETAEDAGIV